MKTKWWKEATAYQIYLRSFMDSNGDGIGDIKGITAKLDYLKELGIDLLWICPFYKSPNDDNGYDISDYQDVLSEFGTMNDFDELLAETHKRDMKLIIDLVINHTSDEHPWFIESKSSKNNPKRDWYIWKEGKDGEEPNNWESIFKGSAWEYDKNTEEYFLHLFSKKQPDLNWENKDVRTALYDMIKWWLDKGIDGFRVDAISHIKKGDYSDLPNPNKLKYVSSFERHMNVDGIHEFLQELKKETFNKYPIVTVGEANGVKASEASLWADEDAGAFNMLFQFEHLELWDYEDNLSFNFRKYREVLTKWQYELEDKGWNALFVENHDIPRVVSRWGNDREYRVECAKAFALCYFMQKGTPFIYQGQEIGMTNVKYNSIEYYNDIKSINGYKEKINSGMGEADALSFVYSISRDNARTPMHWSSTDNAGFSTSNPWIRLNPNYSGINVENDMVNPNSIWNFYKKIIRLKKESETLIYGKYKLVAENDPRLFAYERIGENEKYLVICNLTDYEASIPQELKHISWLEPIVNNYKECKDIFLPWECRLYKISL